MVIGGNDLKAFDYSKVIAEMEKAISVQDTASLTDKLNPECNVGLQEIIDILHFIPEDAREKSIENFICSMLVT